MKSDLHSIFERFRNGQLSSDTLQERLAAQLLRLTQPADAPLRNVIEQAAARIDMITRDVCEAERDGHIAELLREVESKLARVEP